MNLKKQIGSLVLLFLCTGLLAQRAPFKFGKVEEEDVALKECDFYPEAHSMILGEFGVLRFIYSNTDDQLKYQLEVTVRKKIFNKVDKDAGSFRIRYYEPTSGNSKEEIINLKGYTYNLIDGKVEREKLDKDSKFENRVNDNWKEVSVTMPKVQEGSVIEYTYVLESEFLSTLQTWHFQSDIPVKYSELRVTLPEWYVYQVNNVGSYVPLEYNEDRISETFNYSYRTEGSPGMGGEPPRTVTGTFKSMSTKKTFIAKNVLPVIDEPYMNNKVDIPNRLEFQLISVHMPNSPIRSVAENYEKFNKGFVNRDDFGGRLKKGNFAKDYITDIGDKSSLEKAVSIYDWIRKSITWNGYSGLTSDKAGGPIFNDGEGGVADINLTYAAALREAGIEAYPVLISRRGYGIPHPVYPSYNDFNHLIILCQIDGNSYLSDATSSLPFGMIPENDLNGQGWAVSEQGGFWVDLKANKIHQTILVAQTSIAEGKLINKVSYKEDQYGCISSVYELQKDGEEKFQEQLAGRFPEWELSEFAIEESSLTNGLKYSFSVAKENDDEDIIYVQPLLMGAYTENPFKREERFSPIDFPYSYYKRAINIINLPEGYTPELPEPSVIKLPDNAGTFIYNVTQTGSMVQVMSDLKLNRTDFSQNEYNHLKQFFELMVAKNNSIIVLKKI